MYRIVFFDIDGTLRHEAYGIPESAVRALRGLQSKQYLTCLCTGRIRADIPDDVMGLPVDGVIAGGGSYAEFRNRVMWDFSFPNHDLEPVFHFLMKQRDAGILMEGKDGTYMNGTACRLLSQSMDRKLSGIGREQAERMRKAQKIIYRSNLESFRPSVTQISKCGIWYDPVWGIETELGRLGAWNHMEEAQRGSIDSSPSAYLELIGKGWSKGDAVARLCKSLEIESANILAFGDGMNDVSLLKAAGTGIAMKNGAKELQAFADGVCESVMEDGIYKELQRRKLIG